MWRWRGGAFREQRVALDDSGAFVWREGGPVSARVADYLHRFFPPAPGGQTEDLWYEVNLDALDWLDRIAGALEAGFVFSIDYGYTRSESVRFPAGTLMGYLRHTARDNVLERPGERDITAHVNFTALQEHGASCGLRTLSLETLASALLAAGEAAFAQAIDAPDPAGQLRRRLQLKTLLFGMGETFRVLLQIARMRREHGGRREKTPPQNEKGPGNRGLEGTRCRPGRARPATSSSSEQLFSSGRLSWLRSSSIDSP